MIAYTVYFHGSEGGQFQIEEFSAFDDAAAELFAARLAKEGVVELWRGNRLVKRWCGTGGITAIAPLAEGDSTDGE
jgi:hypothetical protein